MLREMLTTIGSEGRRWISRKGGSGSGRLGFLRTERGRDPNVHGNGKTERKRQDERDGVLTFG
jgi:hypothetical protein